MSRAEPGPRRGVRILLALLAFSAALPGAWATLGPRSFYLSFPGAGNWIALSGPFSEHLARDVGAFYLAFALMFAWAVLRPHPALVGPLCAGWAAFSVLHLAWHAGHLESFTVGNAIAQTVGLLAVLAMAGAVPLLLRSSPDGP